MLMVHDYPPFTGGGLAIAVRELAAELREEFAFRVLSSRSLDHFADDLDRLAAPSAAEEPVCALAAPRRTLRWLREADAIVVHWTFSFRRLSTLLLLAAPLLGKPTVCIIHTAPDHCDYNRMRRFPRFVRSGLFRLVCGAARRCTAVVALSHSHATALAAVGVPASHVLPLPVRGERYGYDQRVRAAQPLRTVLILGELSELKGADAIPRLLPVLAPHFTVRIAGRGPLARQVTAAVEALPPAQRANVAVSDRVDPAAVPLLYEAADCLLVLSRTESQSRVTLEAMLSGVVVLAREVGGIRDLVTNGLTGFLIDPDDPESIREVLLHLAANPAVADGVRQRASEQASDACSRSRREWRRFLLDVASRPESPRATAPAARTFSPGPNRWRSRRIRFRSGASLGSSRGRRARSCRRGACP
jgi:glycosyltransferase involved in cell wall biosynthesis